MPKLIIKIADSGTTYFDPVKGNHSSLTGHMWWEVVDNSGITYSYGFSPAQGYEGKPFAPGSVKYDDNIKYDFNSSKGDYKREFEITDSQLEILKEFGANPFDKDRFNFSSTYNGLKNSCIDFTYKALDIIDFVPEGYDGDVWPTLNIDNIKALPSPNINDSQLFISKEGGLFILDNENQMTVKLFGNASDVDYAKTNSLATDAAKLGSSKVSIQDSSNQNIAKFEIKQGDYASTLNNSALLKEESKFFNKNGEEVSPSDAIIKFEDTDLGKLTAIRTDLTVTLKDNTTSTLGTVLNAIDSAQATAETFINGYMGQIKEMLTSQDAIAGLISDVAAGIQRGDSPEEIAKFVATKLAVKQLLEQGSDAVKNQIQQLLADNPADIAAIEAGDYLSLSSEGAESLRELDAVTNSSAFNFGYKIAIVYATTLILNADEGWDSQEYTESQKFITNDNLKNILKTPQTKLMNHH